MVPKAFTSLLGRAALDASFLSLIEADPTQASAAGLTAEDVRNLRALHEATANRRVAAKLDKNM